MDMDIAQAKLLPGEAPSAADRASRYRSYFEATSCEGILAFRSRERLLKDRKRQRSHWHRMRFLIFGPQTWNCPSLPHEIELLARSTTDLANPLTRQKCQPEHVG